MSDEACGVQSKYLGCFAVFIALQGVNRCQSNHLKCRFPSVLYSISGLVGAVQSLWGAIVSYPRRLSLAASLCLQGCAKFEAAIPRDEAIHKLA